jgi:glycosyltransferase involved in cell wall biosynthesis
MKFRIHTFGIPHLPTTTEYISCAYTQKQIKFCRMMRSRGHEIIFYGHEASAVDCDEMVPVTDDSVLDRAYGGYDWRTNQFRHNIGDPAYQEFNRRLEPALLARLQPGDFVACPFGVAHQGPALAAEAQGARVVEHGIGYTSGHFARWRAYESHAVRTVSEGAGAQNWYSRVIPNYFDLQDFEYRTEKQPWVLYLGRITELKGITTCIQATAAAGVELVIAGQGTLESIGYDRVPDHVRFVGYADRETRRGLMARASALIIASNYLEPFGGVQVEALLSGTPIITPGFGAFAEVNQQGVTGFQCWTLRDFRDAIRERSWIDPAACRAAGLRYTLDQVAPEFERWLQDIEGVYTGQGWSQL